MRSVSLITVLLLAACVEEPPVVISELGAREDVTVCEPLSGPQPPPATISQLQPVSDSTFLLIDEEAREVSLLDARAGRVWTRAFTRDGPHGIARLVDAVLVRDTLLVVGDAGRMRLRAFDAVGEERWSVDTPFPMQRIALAGDRLLVAAVGMDPRIPGLLHELRGEELRPLRVPFATHEDALIRMFVNSVTLQGYADGSVIVAQQFVNPTAWRVDAGGRVTRMVTPVAPATAESFGWTPPMPFTESDLVRMAAPVIASAADPRSGDVLYLTRSGRMRDGRTEKVLVRADDTLGYRSSLVLELNAVALAYLPARPDSVIVVDYDQGWHRCPAP